MTSQYRTPFLSLPAGEPAGAWRAGRGSSALRTRAMRIAFGTIGWPWLLRSLSGGSAAERRRLHQRLDLADDALPHLGSWKADAGFLHRIVDAIELLRPATVVELGAGASTLVAARALALHGGGRLVSFDQHRDFVDQTARWLADQGAAATIRHAPLAERGGDWPGAWYDLSGVPDCIDLLVIDGPPWTVHPFVRGAAECLFDRLTPGGILLLDDAARPGERIVARRWRRRWPDIRFERVGGSSKGTLVGRKSGAILPMPVRRAQARVVGWRPAAAAALALAFAGGWAVGTTGGDVHAPAMAYSFLDQAAAAQRTAALRATMAPRLAETTRDADAVERSTGIALPDLPAGWRVRDVHLHPAGRGTAVELALVSDEGAAMALYASHAETPAEDGKPLLDQRAGQPIGYWEQGDTAYALTAALPPRDVMALSAELAGG